jgi:predicted ATPase/DNA-binding SARP family transcriptional activator
MPKLELFTLGPPILRLDGNIINLPRRKALAILVYLIYNRQSRQREELATLFWPEASQDEAYAYLRQVLWEIKKVLGSGWLLADRESVGVNPARDIWLDADEFHHQLSVTRGHGHPASLVCVKCLDPLSRLAELYQGDFLTGFSLRDSPEFDDWQFFQVETLRREFIAILTLLQKLHEQGGELEQALACAHRRVSLDPLNEDGHRTLMQLYFQTGQRNAALRQYQECSRILKVELHISPENATTQLYEHIRASKDVVKGKDTYLVTAQEPEVNLPSFEDQPARVKIPIPTTPFVGRKNDLAEIAQLLHDPACHLLTLLGPGGIGKTRIAIQTAQDQREAFPYGVFFIPLAGVQSRRAMLLTILEALDMALHSSEPMEQDELIKILVDYLLLKKVLLVLDNFEHLIDEASVIGKMIANAPDLKMMVTSRQQLNLAGEWIKEIHGMSYPKDEPLEPATIQGYSAVQLFIQSAKRAQAGFQVASNDYSALVQITRLVEGTPLALELAAAWVRVLSLPEIASEIECSLDFLASDLQDIPKRQRSIRAIFEHSWQLLTGSEQQAFAQLSVFHQPFTRQAAEEITGITLRDLLVLMSKSLLQRTEDNRYEMHSLLHFYTAQKLNDYPDLAVNVHENHCNYYLNLLAGFDNALKGGFQKQAITEISVDILDIKAAWNWAVDQHRIALLYRSVESLDNFHEYQMHLGDAEAAIDKAIKVFSVNPGLEENRLLVRLYAIQAFTKTNLQEIRNLAEKSLAIISDTQLEPKISKYDQAMAFASNGFAYFTSKNYKKAKEFYDQSIDLFDQIGEYYWKSNVIIDLANLEVEKANYNGALEYAEQSLQIKRKLEDQYGIANLLRGIGNGIGYFLDNYDKAIQILYDGAQVYRSFGDMIGIALSLECIDDAMVLQGRFAELFPLRLEKLRIYQQMGNTIQVFHSKSNIGEAFQHLGDFAQAENYGREGFTGLSGAGILLSEEEGFSILSLGLTLLTLRKFSEARELFMRLQNLEIVYSPLSWKSIANYGLCMADTMDEKFLQARNHIQMAIKLIREQKHNIYILYVISAAALLLAYQGEYERAVELYALVTRHPFAANSVWFQDMYEKPILLASANLSPDTITAAQARGRSLKIWETVGQLIKLMDANSFEFPD